jgi:hypothetical protein
MSNWNNIGSEIGRANKRKQIFKDMVSKANDSSRKNKSGLSLDDMVSAQKKELQKHKKQVALVLNNKLNDKDRSVGKDILGHVWKHMKKGGKLKSRRNKRGGMQTKRNPKTYRPTPYNTTGKSNEELIHQLKKVVEYNCGIKFHEPSQEYKEGDMRGCAENILSISHNLWINNGKQFPVEWYSAVIPLKSKGDRYSNEDNYYKLLRSIIFALKENVNKYSKEFLEYFFMQMEESSVTGIYTVDKGSGFDKFLKNNFASYNMPDDGRGTNGTISNSAINQFFLKELRGGGMGDDPVDNKKGNKNEPHNYGFPPEVDLVRGASCVGKTCGFMGSCLSGFCQGGKRKSNTHKRHRKLKKRTHKK